jgi:hypothetical protein
VYELEFSISGLPTIISNGSQGSWKVKYSLALKWKRLVCDSVGNHRPTTPLKKAKCEFVRASAFEPDYDNLVISFKAIRDGLVQAGVLENDKSSNMPDPVYRWECAKRGAGFIRVSVREIQP